MSALPAPVAESERIAALDTLRGVAILGILVMNIQSFSMLDAAYLNPTAYGDLTGWNLRVWQFGHLFFDQKFISIFSMLFGAGTVLLTRRIESTGQSAARIYFRRTLWLILFGLLHAYLLWSGDILYTYSVCALWTYFFRKRKPASLIASGLLVTAIGAAIWLLIGLSMPSWPEKELADFTNENWMPRPETAAAELADYRGGWLQQMRQRVPNSFEFQTVIFLIWGLWYAGGRMLLGMAFCKMGVFSAKCSRGVYFAFLGVALFVGLPLIAYGMFRNFAAHWDVTYSFFLGSEFNNLASLLVALGWIGAVMLACQSVRLAGVMRRFAAVGRMAFTNYVMQTILCTTIFYGHGFGYFGRVERTGQITIVACVWAAQLIWSPIWLRHFQFGPFEWVWRSLTYGQCEPMRRRTLVAAVSEIV